MLGLDLASLAGLFSASILYGMYVLLFLTSLYAQFYKRSTPRPNLVMLVASILLFVLITLVLALSFSRVADAFVYYRDAPGGPLLVLASVTDWKTMTMQILGLVTCIFADSILIYKCWMVWSQSWRVVAFPLVMLLSSIALLIFSIVELSRTALYTASVLTTINESLQAFMILTLCQNIIVTSLIVWKLWHINSAAASHRNIGSLVPVIAIVIESGTLYSITLVVFVAVTFTDVFVEEIMSSILGMMIGITFSSIFVRIGLTSKASETASEPFITSRSMSQQASALNPQPFTVPIARRVKDESSDIALVERPLNHSTSMFTMNTGHSHGNEDKCPVNESAV